jgi:outer membrane cobalamin receptor
MNKESLFLLSVLCLTQVSAKAAEDIEVFTVTGSHINHKMVNNIPKVTIDAETIAALAPNSIGDVLSTVPGIDIFEQGGLGGLTFLSLKGGDPSFVVFTIDGDKVNDPTNSRGGAFYLGTIDPAIIDKIDIYYDSFSTVYGSDALSGVISITTKKAPAGELVIASIKTGSNNMLGGMLHLNTDVVNVANLTVTGTTQNGAEGTFGDDFERNVINASFNSINNVDLHWQLGAYYSNGQSKYFPEDSGGDRLAVIRTPESRDYSQQNYSANLQQNITPKLNLNLTTSLAQRNETIYNPGIAAGTLEAIPAINSSSDYQHWNINSMATYQIDQSALLAIGASITREDGSMDSIIDFGFPVPANYTLKRTTKAVYLESSINATNKLNFTGSVRHDNAEQRNINTIRLTSSYQINAASSISAEYSEGYKLPSFFALAHPFVGNAELKPETSKNYDVTFKQTLSDKLSIRLSAYQNTYKNLVDFDPELFTNINRSKVSAQGTEWSVNYDALKQLNISGNVSYNKIETFEDNVVLRRRPKWKANLQMNYQPLNTLSLITHLSYNDNYIDSSIPTGMVDMAGDFKVNLSTRWQILPRVALRFAIKNITNSKIEEAIGFKNEGRSLTASITASF